MSKGFISLLGDWVGGYAELWDLYKSDNERKINFLYQNNQPTVKSLELVQGCLYSGLLVLGLGYLLYLFYTTPNLEQTSFMILILTYLYMALMFAMGFFACFVLLFLGITLGQWLAKNKSVGLKSYWALCFVVNGLYWAAIVLLIRLVLPDVLGLVAIEFAHSPANLLRFVVGFIHLGFIGSIQCECGAFIRPTFIGRGRRFIIY